MPKFSSRKPGRSLSPYVVCFWALEGCASQERPWIHRTLANCYPEIIFHYSGPFEELCDHDRIESSFVTGIHSQTDRFRRFVVKESFGIFGVSLQPYAIPALFGFPSSEIRNEMPDLAGLLGSVGREISEEVILARSNAQRFKIVSQFLEARIVRFERPEIKEAIQCIYSSNGLANVKQLAADSGFSQRHFERRFKEEIGFSPKTFSRLVRFNSLVSSNHREYQSLTEMAFDFGYYDQSHFIRDFRQFTGYSPGRYFRGNAPEIWYPD